MPTYSPKANEIERQSIIELLSHEDVEITSAGTGAEALEALRATRFDCVILDLRLPDISGFELLENIRQNPERRELPIVVCTGKDLTDNDSVRLARMAESVVLKDVQSPERLLDEVSLFLHLVAADPPANKQKMLERLRQSDEALTGKKTAEAALNDLLESQLPAAVEASLQDAARAVEDRVGRLAQEVAQVDPTLEGAARSTLTRMQDDLKKLHGKVIQAAKRKDDTLRRQYHHAQALVFPGGHPQEREVGFVSFLNKYGPSLVDRLSEEIPLDMGTHWVVQV